MGLIDEWAERYIVDAQKNGEFDDLSGNGKPLQLDDDALVPMDLRVGYRLLKNAGFLPPELLDRQEALTIVDLLSQLDSQHGAQTKLRSRLILLEMRLEQAGFSTDFLHQEYQHRVADRLSNEE